MKDWLQAAQQGAKATARHASSNKNSHLLHWLVSLGGVGLFGVSIIDSSVIPLPLPGSTDLLLIILAVHRGTSSISVALLALCAIAGSILGGYLTWSAGRKGGEVALEKHVPKRFLKRINGWVEKHGAWSIGIAALLPPPVPLTPFLLVAGALNVPRGRFLIFYSLARTIRYGGLAWLAVTYGRRFVHAWQKQLAGWANPVLWIYGVLLVLGIGYGFWKWRKARQAGDRTATEEAA
jgi:membrane protein YqaA with SNARE-associated domain